MPVLTLDIYLFLFLSAVSAGFVDSVAGGGGLIALPALLFAGLPPVAAFGTNKFQGSFGTLTASIQYFRKGAMSLKECLPGIAFTFIGAAAGAAVIQRMDTDAIGRIIPILLFAVFLYSLKPRSFVDEARPPRFPRMAFLLVFGLGLGFYDGFFGPGTGAFWMAGFSLLLGESARRAAGQTRIMNFTSNIVSLSLFILGGHVLFTAGLVMAAGQIIGARVGSAMAMKKGAAFIRPVFILVAAATIIRLAWVYYL